MGHYEDYLASEYSRRNLQVCKVIGAKASINLAIERASSNKSTPKWLMEYLVSAQKRLENIAPDLADFRDMAPDKDEWVSKPITAPA